MKPLNLEEFAEELRRKGDWREADFADDILALVDIEAEVAEPYGELRSEIEHYAKDGGFSNPDDALKAAEWLGDRSNLLQEIEEELTKAGHKGDADDVVKAMIGTLADAEAILEAAGWPGDGDFIAALQALAERPAPMEYDL